jgi:hypothetical protein
MHIYKYIYTRINIHIYIGGQPLNSKRIPEAPLEITENSAKPLNLTDDFTRQKLAKIAVMNGNNSNSFLSPLVGRKFETSQR